MTIIMKHQKILQVKRRTIAHLFILVKCTMYVHCTYIKIVNVHSKDKMIKTYPFLHEGKKHFSWT